MDRNVVLAAILVYSTIVFSSLPVFAIDGGPIGNPLPTGCTPTYAGAVNDEGHLVTYQAEATISCYRPGNTAPYGARSAIAYSAPANGTSCELFDDVPVTLEDLPAYIRATWIAPDGTAGVGEIDPSADGTLLSEAGQIAATSDIYAVYARQGTYQGGQCLPQGPWLDYCAAFQASPVTDPCILAQPHVITPATSPPPPITPYIQQVVRQIHASAGTIASLPIRGLVNLPTCFWINGITVSPDSYQTLVLAGPPDPSGRRIYYTYVIHLWFGGVEWNFDDPFGNDQVQPSPACGQHPQLTAHSYQMISDKRHSDRMYHVTAQEQYYIFVNVYWADSYGTHEVSVNPGIPMPITVSPPQYEQYVGQIEGIPVGPS
jgi:hypothetical protein